MPDGDVRILFHLAFPGSRNLEGTQVLLQCFSCGRRDAFAAFPPRYGEGLFTPEDVELGEVDLLKVLLEHGHDHFEREAIAEHERGKFFDPAGFAEAEVVSRNLDQRSLPREQGFVFFHQLVANSEELDRDLVKSFTPTGIAHAQIAGGCVDEHSLELHDDRDAEGRIGCQRCLRKRVFVSRHKIKYSKKLPFCQGKWLI